ncbi:MAG: NAD(P)/FAD-dependent oxidoreductase [Planctomycetota bacterium]|jgi:predicted NAD/FAD-binding protein
MRIAVVGTGISGLLAARLLCAEHEVVVFEAADRLGGHTHTRTVERDGKRWDVDSGFIVFNHRTYPNLTRLFELLGVETRESSMTFSVRNRRSGLEWCGTNLDTLFAQRRNLLSPGFLGMVRDVFRFNKQGPELVPTLDADITLGEVLERGGYGRRFIEDYIVPMGAAIWSAEPRRMPEFPALTFLRFFDNHGMLSVGDRPTWRTVVGGSHAYIDPLVEPFRDQVRLSSPVTWVKRVDGGVELAAGGGRVERFDEVVLALHSDQALRLLADPSWDEREILRALPYQRNEAVLHTDESVLPRSRKARAAWNYVVPEHARDTVSVTYDMNTLQGLESRERFLVTLNPCEAIDPDKVIERMTYHHPIFDTGGIAAQARRDEIDGRRRTHYCGAYWRYGFHEDGVLSALHVARRFGVQGIDGVERSSVRDEAPDELLRRALAPAGEATA